MTKPVFYTKHALSRGFEYCYYDEKDLRKILKRSLAVKPPRHVTTYKLVTYWMDVSKTFYFYDQSTSLNHTVIEKDNCYLVLTVFKKRQKQYTIDNDAPNIVTSSDALPAYV